MHPHIRHEPDADHPGWWSWETHDPPRYSATLGTLLVQSAGPGRARCRMFPGIAQSNLNETVHGGAILNFIDMSFFAGGYMAGFRDVQAVTLDTSVQFIGAGRLGVPLDAEVELLRETGRLAFLRGLVVQEGATLASFTGTLRKTAVRAQATSPT